MKRKWTLLLVFVVVLGFSGVSSATLSTIGTATYSGNAYNLIYEDDQGLVWLDYTKGFDNWTNQVDWAAGLNTPGVLAYNLNPGISVTWGEDWRLPATVDGLISYGNDGTTTGGYNITSSEMGHLYYTSLGNLGYYDTSGDFQAGWGLVNKAPFDNLQAYHYWSGTEYSEAPLGAWFFSFIGGGQDLDGKVINYYALAVRPGEVVFAPVPEPATMLLMGSGLLAFATLRRKFKKR